MDEHQAKVRNVSRQVAIFYKQKKPFYIYHGSTNSTRYLQFKQGETIDVSSLDQVLSVDSDRQTVTVEPNVPMDRLVQATLAEGLVPKVVMEFPGITVGGGIQGFAGESSSYKWGLFHAPCTSMEMILGNGEIVTASPKKNSDLFYGSPGSYGSLGIITAATLSLMPAKKYVNLTYIPVGSFEESVKVIEQHRNNPDYDYLDGIIYSKTEGIIMLGKLSDDKVGRVARFSRSFDDWFALHAEDISRRRTEYTESIPLVDYLFRYDRGAFWVGRFPFEEKGWPFNRLTRWVLDPILHTRKLYEALHASGASQQYIIQDLPLPVDNTVKFMDYIDKQFGTYPMWLCPLTRAGDWKMLRPGMPETVINVGVWDRQPYPDRTEFERLNRQLEAKLNQLNGQKTFYARSFYTEKEFWDIYDKKSYDKLRKKYHAETLPNVYEKIRTKGHKPIRIKRAALQTVLGKGKLHIEK